MISTSTIGTPLLDGALLPWGVSTRAMYEIYAAALSNERDSFKKYGYLTT